MPNEDILMDQAVETLLKRDRRVLEAAARRAADNEDARDLVESYMFQDLDWEPIPATVISDIAFEIANVAHPYLP